MTYAETDVTAKITNPNFSTDAQGWTITGSARSYDGTGFDADKFIELTTWGSEWDATVSQTVSGLDNGYYRVKAAGQMSGASDCWMKLVANGAENYFSRNGNTNGNILANGTETAIGSGVAGWRYSAVIAKVTDGTLEISCVGHSDVKERWANFDHVTLTYLGESIAAGTDVSDFINNWDFWGCYNEAFNGWSISAPNGGNTWKNGESNVEYWIGTAANGSFDYYQELTGLPSGKYSISASMWNSTNSEEGTPSVNGNAGVYGTISSGTVFAGVDAESTNASLVTKTTDEFVITNGELRLGVKNNGTMGARWFGVDWIKLTYVEPCISAIATEIPSATATDLTADKWYKFTAASTDNYSFATTTISDIVCTSTDQLLSEATGTAATAIMALTSGTTYYIKSSSAQTLTITPQTFTYSVGDGTPSVADGKYTQNKTFTLTFADANTDDPAGEFQILDASKITVNSAAVTASITGNVLTITLADALTASTDYAISVAAGAVGYKADAANAAISLTVKTPDVFDGTYYLYDATNKKFLSRGKNYGSRAVVDLYGIPFNLVTDGNGASLISFSDWNDKYLFFDKDDHAACWLYTDGGASNANRFFAFEAATGGYYLRDAAKAVYIKHDNSVLTVPTTSEAEATVWTVMPKTERDAIVNAYPAANKTNVITAASLTSETDAAGFEAYLAANYAAEDKTASVGTAKFTGSAGDWTWTSVTGSPTYGTDWTEGFQIAGTWSQTISGLTPGIYKVTVNGFERKAGYELCNTLGAEGYEPVTAYFKANDEQLPLASWYSEKEGTNNPDNTTQAATAFNNDKYKNTIYTYVADGGEGTGSLTLTIGKQDKASGSWVLFNNVTLTYYNNSLSEEQKTAIIADATTEMAKPMKPSLYQALVAAKTTFEGNQTMANYNALRTAIDNTATSVASYAAMNTNYLEPIAALLASSNIIDKTTSAYTDYEAYKAKYDNYTNAETADIENATANALTLWQSNGARYTNIANILMTTGWQIGGADALTDGSGFYANTWSTEDTGTAPAKDFARPFYEMWVSSGSIAAATLTRTITGLTANGFYKVSANVRVEVNDKVAGSITMQAGSGTAVDVTAGSKIGSTSRYIGAYTAYGQADADGKLTITITVAADSKITWLAFRDLKYEAVVVGNVTISETADYTPVAEYANVTLTRSIKANNWNSFVVPFDISNSELTTAFGADVAVAEYSETADGDNSTVNFTKMATPAVKANVPVLLKTSTSGSSYNFAGRVITTGDAKVAGTNFDFTGTYDASTTIAAGDWFINTDKLYKSTGATTIKGTRAYIKTKVAGARITNLTIDGNDATAIESLKVDNANGKIYNLQGQEVNKGQKGVFIQNGKKMVVK